MASSSNSAPVPFIHALCMEERFSDALQKAMVAHNLPSCISITFHDCALSFIPSSVQFDAIVSPANSYGRLDGGFDDAISRAFSPRDDYLALTRAAQARLYDEWRGFAPPGTCTLLRIPHEFRERSRNVWGTRHLALCPTMRVPQEVTWDREIVYEGIWSLLCAIDRHNRAARDEESEHGDEIQSILMAPMATGIGKVSAERWASQVVLALKHYVDAVEKPVKWSALGPEEIFDYSNAVVDTWTL